jgi:hypothetical protein
MNLRSLRLTAVIGLLALLPLTLHPAVAESPKDADLVGRWQGTLAVGDVQLRLVFEVRQSGDGVLEATLDSPDQGATGIPVASVQFDGSSVRFDVSVLGATFEGRLTDERAFIDGEWRQSGQTFPLNCERVKEV